MGLSEKSQYTFNEHPIETGDIIILFTDGIFEVFDKKNNFFGDKKFINLLEKEIGDIHLLSMKELNNTIIEKVSEFGKIEDDITLIAVKIF